MNMLPLANHRLLIVQYEPFTEQLNILKKK